MNRFILIISISNQILIRLTFYCIFYVIKFIIKIKQCQIRNLNRRISGIRKAGNILYICNNFHTNKFVKFFRNFITLTHNGNVCVPAIQNSVKRFIIFVILISNIDRYFRISTVKGQ